ncbi:hypothetical protein EC988_002778 [Linderina pennispora]|nr:hypothetical protein EC988_002778 [Linderina pennispora]
MDNRRIHFTVGSSMSISSQSASDDSAMEDISNGNIPSSLESAVSSSRSTLACSAASSMSTACDEAEPSGESMLARCKQFFKRLNHRSGLQPASSAEKAWPALPDSSLTYVQSDSGLSFRSVSSGITIAPASSRGASMPVLSSAAETMGGGRTALWTSVGADGWVKRRQW